MSICCQSRIHILTVCTKLSVFKFFSGNQPNENNDDDNDHNRQTMVAFGHKSQVLSYAKHPMISTKKVNVSHISNLVVNIVLSIIQLILNINYSFTNI